MLAELIDNIAAVRSDGVTVWVDSPTGTIARFGRLGIDVHTADTSGCLHCTHEDTSSPEKWQEFRTKVAEHHGVIVSNLHRPRRCSESET